MIAGNCFFRVDAHAFFNRILSRILLIGLVLVSLQPAVTGGINLNWQYVFTEEDVVSVGVMGDRFVAVTGQSIWSSSDAINWRKIHTLEGTYVQHALFTEGNLTLFTNTFGYGAVQSEQSILTSSNLTEWDLQYLPTENRDGMWERVQEVGGNQVITFVSEERSIALASVNGVDWEVVITREGRLGGPYRTADDRYILTLGHLDSPPVWIETADGFNWIRHNQFFGSYVEINGRFIGLNTDGLVLSQDFETWEVLSFFDIDDPLHRGPTRLLGGEDSVLVVRNARQTFATQDGINWTEGSLPDMPAVSGPVGALTFQVARFQGSFWVRRQWSFPPTVEPSADDSRVVVHRSEDGLNWEAAQWPEGLVDEGAPIVVGADDLPADAEHLRGAGLRHPFALSTDSIRLEIRKVPDGTRYALYQQSVGGPEEVVMTSWGSLWEPHFPYSEPVQLVGRNGVFLCMNTLHHLGMLDLKTARLPQPRVRCEQPWRPDSIGISWSAVPGADSYKLIRSEKRGEALLSEELIETADTSYTDDSPDLRKGIVYTYQALAQGPDMQSSLPGEGDEGSLWSLEGELNIGETFLSEWTGWQSLDWFEDLYLKKFPWVWNAQHHWWYLVEQEIGFFIWDAALGWLWSDRDLYPVLYSVKEDNWLYYLKNSAGPRWFYSYRTAAWAKVD